MSGRRGTWTLTAPIVALVTLVTATACALPALPPGEPTPIPTSDWTGGSGMSAALTGILTRDAEGCLVVEGMTVLWPRGFTAVRAEDGSVTVLDTARRVVARTGMSVELGGGGGVPGYSGPCIDGRDFFMVTYDLPPLEGR